MTQLLLKYHTVAPERLVAAALRDLAASGIPERALGRVLAAARASAGLVGPLRAVEGSGFDSVVGAPAAHTSAGLVGPLRAVVDNGFDIVVEAPAARIHARII